MSDDAFEFQRRNIRALQMALTNAEAEYQRTWARLHDQAASYEIPSEAIGLTTRPMLRRIADIEMEISRAMSMLPPHAEFKNGALYIYPVHHAIDPRATV